MHDQSIAELAAGLRARRFSSRELTQHFLDRIERLDPALNSYITRGGEQALAAADAADARLAGGDAGPLTGIPIAHKDIFSPPASAPAAHRACWTASSRRSTPPWWSGSPPRAP
jgi:Asp-tRNA(Asn)/Glu-tRNA(Gln) amidotransferase A subunit family amidase